MKKVIFLVAALLVVFSGVAAVSAYEGHMVDVKAHVENALMVNTVEADLGITFPEEKVETDIIVGLSESFRAQTRYSTVLYNVYWEPKPIEEGYVDLDQDGYFEPIYPFIDLDIEGDNVYDVAKDGPNGTIWVADGKLYMDDMCDTIHLVFDPPVFDKWYNILTDPRTPSGVLEEGEYSVVTEEAACGFTASVPHVDLGSNLKIQVTDVVLDVPVTSPSTTDVQ